MKTLRPIVISLAITVASATTGCDKVRSAYCSSIAPSLANVCTDKVQAELTLERGAR